MAGFDLLCGFIEGFPANRVARIVTGESLPATDRYIDVERIQLHTITASSDPLRSDYGGAATKKRIENDIAARRDVHDCVGHQRGRLHGGVQGEQIAFLPRLRERTRAGVVPHVGAVATIPPELDVVAMC